MSTILSSMKFWTTMANLFCCVNFMDQEFFSKIDSPKNSSPKNRQKNVADLRDMDLGDSASEKWNAINSINIRLYFKQLLANKPILVNCLRRRGQNMSSHTVNYRHVNIINIISSLYHIIAARRISKAGIRTFSRLQGSYNRLNSRGNIVSLGDGLD